MRFPGKAKKGLSGVAVHLPRLGGQNQAAGLGFLQTVPNPLPPEDIDHLRSGW